VVGWVYTIEFQKRGLPHAHMLFILDKEHNFDENTEDDYELRRKIDAAVSAELPDKKDDPDLYDLVKKHMIHHPCQNDPQAICMQNGKCKRGFPKEYCDYTKIP
jgi:hypothetical protein